MFRLITPALYRSMPWKNGAGRTTEIAAHPPGSELGTFAWRISVADVDRDGPFSKFPGIDRVIVLLEGAGMRLRGGGRDVDLRTPFEPYAFAGDDDVDCTLVAGPVRDFNAMCRRGRARAEVSMVGGDGGSVAPAAFRVVYAVSGTHECTVAGHAPVRVAPGRTLLVETGTDFGEDAMAIRPHACGGVALAVRIECA